MDLQKMLVKSSPFLDECEKMKNEPCPYGEKCNYGKKCRYMHEKPQQTRSARNRHFMRMYGPKTTKENMPQTPQQTLNTCNNNLPNNVHMVPRQQSFNLPNRSVLSLGNETGKSFFWVQRRAMLTMKLNRNSWDFPFDPNLVEIVAIQNAIYEVFVHERSWNRARPTQ